MIFYGIISMLQKIKQKRSKMQKVIKLQPEKVEVHDVASLHRYMSEQEYLSLKTDIESNGQLVPVILYRGKLVDGRHRKLALIELGIHDMNCIELPHNITLQEVKEKVIGTEMRRTDNEAQKAIRALRWINEESDRSQQDAAIKFGVNKATISRAKKLLDNIGEINIQKLYDNGYLMFNGKKYTTIIKILAYLSTDEEEQIDRPPVSDWVRDITETLYQKFKTEDFVGIAQVESIAKSLRQKEQ